MTYRTTPKRSQAALFAVAVGLWVSCHHSGSTPAKGNLYVVAQAQIPETIALVELMVQSPTALAEPIRIPLMNRYSQSSVLLKNLPVADDYVLTADALDAGGAIIAHGWAIAAIVKNKTTEVILYLNRLVPTKVGQNSSPIIDTILLSADSVEPNGQITLTAAAHDPDPGQTATLAFTWTSAVSCGSVDAIGTVPGTDALAPSISRALFTAPPAARRCTVTLTVKDILGLATSVAIPVRVGGAPDEQGIADVQAVFNNAPVVSSISSAPAQLTPNATTSGVVQVDATDPEGDPLTYQWLADPAWPCTVTFQTPTDTSTAFTATPTRPDATECVVRVEVRDGVWPDTGKPRNLTVATLVLPFQPPVVARLLPSFGIGYQSSDVAVGGSEILVATVARDPEGGALTFEWKVASPWDAPRLVTPTDVFLDSVFSTAAMWTVPAAAMDAPDDVLITVTATSSKTGLSASKSFHLIPAHRG